MVESASRICPPQRVAATSISDRARKTGSLLPVFPPEHHLHHLESVAHRL